MLNERQKLQTEREFVVLSHGCKDSWVHKNHVELFGSSLYAQPQKLMSHVETKNNVRFWYNLGFVLINRLRIFLGSRGLVFTVREGNVAGAERQRTLRRIWTRRGRRSKGAVSVRSISININSSGAEEEEAQIANACSQVAWESFR